MSINFTTEGKLEVKGGNIWYGIVGKATGKPPLILVHGGPGYPSYEFETFQVLGDERQIVFYDQLGCGRSDRVTDTSLFTLERYVDELAEIRRFLNLNEVHLFAHSWGAKIVTAYMLRKPVEIRSLVFCGPDFYSRRWMADMQRHLDEMPDNIGEVIRVSEKNGTTDTPEYKNAARQFYEKHECRLIPVPDCMVQASAERGAQYEYLFGPNEYTCTGTMCDWDQTDQLHKIKVPTLITCGRYDGCPPQTADFYRSKIPDAELAIFEQSAHMPFLEEPEFYFPVIRNFLYKVESDLMLKII